MSERKLKTPRQKSIEDIQDTAKFYQTYHHSASQVVTAFEKGSVKTPSGADNIPDQDMVKNLRLLYVQAVYSNWNQGKKVTTLGRAYQSVKKKIMELMNEDEWRWKLPSKRTGDRRMNECLRGDTLIYTEHGATKISEVVDNDKGDYVLGCSSTGLFIPVKILRRHNIRHNGRFIANLTLSNGSYLNCSLDHYLATGSGWMSAHNLLYRVCSSVYIPEMNGNGSRKILDKSRNIPSDGNGKEWGVIPTDCKKIGSFVRCNKSEITPIRHTPTQRPTSQIGEIPHEYAETIEQAIMDLGGRQSSEEEMEGRCEASLKVFPPSLSSLITSKSIFLKSTNKNSLASLLGTLYEKSPPPHRHRVGIPRWNNRRRGNNLFITPFSKKGLSIHSKNNDFQYITDVDRLDSKQIADYEPIYSNETYLEPEQASLCHLSCEYAFYCDCKENSSLFSDKKATSQITDSIWGNKATERIYWPVRERGIRIVCANSELKPSWAKIQDETISFTKEPLYDLTTTTGNYLANDMLVHNCADSKYWPDGITPLISIKAGVYAPNPTRFEGVDKLNLEAVITLHR